jgi:hypothetical protein
MALYKKSQLAKKYGKTPAAVTVSVSRGKLVLSGDYIDDTHPLNQDTLKKWGDKLKNKRHEKSQPPGNKRVDEPVVSHLPEPKGIEDPQVRSDYGGDGLDAQKKRAEIELKKEQTLKTKLQNQKLRGESIPTDQVKKVVAMLGHSFQSSYKNSADQFLTDVCHKLKAPPEIEAELKGKLVKLINKSHENAITEAKKQLKSIIEQNAVAQLNNDDDE